MLAATWWQWFWFANYLVVALGVISVLRRPREPRAMVAWILALLLLPVLAPLVYVLIGELKVERTKRRRHRRGRNLREPRILRSEKFREAFARAGPPSIESGLHDVVRLATHLSDFPPTRDNEVTIFYDAEKTFVALKDAIRAARSHIHFEFYIFQYDETGRAIGDMLLAKAAEGVKCRVLLDAIGCWRMPRRFVKKLRAGGVEVAFFLPILAWGGGLHVNLRNHRKIVVIDGEIGFTGSQNIGNEYLGRRRKYGPWRDTHMRLVGSAVQQLQDVFLEDWHFAARQNPSSPDLFPPTRGSGRHAVHVIPSGPDVPASVLHQILFAAVTAARKSICIITPYFIPDGAMMLSFMSAAYRGVRTTLLIPSQSNHRLSLWAGRSYYEELTSAGVEVFEYDHGMLHSKVVVVDRSWAMVGSANMDARSFRLNFELTTLLYDAGLAADLQADFDALLARAKPIKPTGRKYWTFRESLSIGVARLASPLL